MRAVVQRVSEASVTVDGRVVSAIGPGLLILVAVVNGDTRTELDAIVEKISVLRVFPDEDGRMNRSLIDTGGSALVVSQFTLAADVRRGRRPSFTSAADPAVAAPMVEAFVAALEARGVPTETGVFGAMMNVSLVNDGPVTVIVDAVDGAIR